MHSQSCNSSRGRKGQPTAHSMHTVRLVSLRKQRPAGRTQRRATIPGQTALHAKANHTIFVLHQYTWHIKEALHPSLG